MIRRLGSGGGGSAVASDDILALNEQVDGLEVAAYTGAITTTIDGDAEFRATASVSDEALTLTLQLVDDDGADVGTALEATAITPAELSVAVAITPGTYRVKMTLSGLLLDETDFGYLGQALLRRV